MGSTAKGGAGIGQMLGHFFQDWQEVEDVILAVDHELVGATEK